MSRQTCEAAKSQLDSLQSRRRSATDSHARIRCILTTLRKVSQSVLQHSSLKKFAMSPYSTTTTK